MLVQHGPHWLYTLRDECMPAMLCIRFYTLVAAASAAAGFSRVLEAYPRTEYPSQFGRRTKRKRLIIRGRVAPKWLCVGFGTVAIE